MSYVKLDFLNWRPDQDDWLHDGLRTAEGVLHSEEGWRPFRFPTTGAFSTQTAIGVTTINSIICKPFGNAGELACAVVSRATPTTSGLRIGVIGEAGPFTTTTFATMASVGAASLRSFDVAEISQYVVITAEAEVEKLGGGFTTYALGGTFTYTVTSV